MHCRRFLITISKQNPLKSISFSHSSGHLHGHIQITPPQQHRLISSTTSVASWMDKVKGVFTGKKEESKATAESFTLDKFADELKNARRVGSFKQFIVGRSSEVTFAEAFERMEKIVRYLSAIDSTGENLSTSQKQDAANHCNCKLADVETALAQFTWAKEAHIKMEKLKQEGKPIPTTIAEVQKLMGSTPLQVARSNLAKSGQLSRNAPCPCGSKKRYKRCCGKDL